MNTGVKDPNSHVPESLLILDGRRLRDIRALRLSEVICQFETTPGLVVIQIGDLAESNAYIEQKRKFAQKIGVNFIHKKFDISVSEEELIKEIKGFNLDQNVHGIIVQLPVPERLNKHKIIDTILFSKDTDGLTTENKKRFEEGGIDFVVPATARGVLTLLRGYGIEVKDKKVTVIGRSELVGAPIATLLLREGSKVSVCHSKTSDVPSKSHEADILIVAIGKPCFIDERYVSSGQVVVDVGINSVEAGTFNTPNVLKLEYEIPRRQIVGDVDFEKVKNIIKAISPVPGGVGPMTVLSLFENLIDAYSKNNVSNVAM